MEERRATLHWTGAFPEGLEIQGLSVEFSHTWTKLLGVVVTAGGNTRSLELPGQLRATADWSDDLLVGTGEAAVLSVEYEGETPELIALHVDADDSGESLTAWYPQGMDPSAGVSTEICELLWALELERVAVPALATPGAGAPSAGTTGAEVFEERIRALGYDALVKRAWYEFDLDTNPDIVHGEWGITLYDLSYRLWNRLQLRFLFGATCMWPAYGTENAANIERATQVSAVFRRCMLSLEAETRQDLVDWAFEFFVCGHALTRHNDMQWQALLLTHGAPNSTEFFKFTELAIFCLEEGIDEDFWKKHLRTLIRTVHIFLEAACPLSDDPYPAQTSQFKLDLDRYYPRSRRLELRTEYETGVGSGLAWNQEFDALRARFGSLLGIAIKGEVLNSSNQTEVIAPEFTAILKPLGVGTPKTQDCGSVSPQSGSRAPDK